MVFVQFLKSLDELLFELVSWIVFFPVTLARVLRRPLAMMVHAEAELNKPADEQFDDALSPPVFLVLAVLIAHAAEMAVIGPDAVVASKRGLAALVDDNTSLLLLRLATFGIYPVMMALNMVRREGRHVCPGDGFEPHVARLCQQHGAHAQRQVRGGRLPVGHVGKRAGKAGEGLDFQQQRCHVDLRQARRQLRPQVRQLLGFRVGRDRAEFHR